MKQIISHLPQYAVGYVAVIVSFLAAFGWLGLSTSAFLFWSACAFLLWTGYELLVRGLCRLPVRIGGTTVPVISPEERLARERAARKEFAREQQEQTVRRIDTVADYARDTMAAYMREEHLPLLQAQVRRFATGGDLEVLPLETVGTGTHGGCEAHGMASSAHVLLVLALRKLRLVLAAALVTVAAQLAADSTLVYADCLSDDFYRRFALTHRENCVPLSLGKMFHFMQPEDWTPDGCKDRHFFRQSKERRGIFFFLFSL